jgi:hypothetical protein
MDYSNSDYGENNIEFVRNSDRATCYFTQGRFISKIKKLAEQYPDECEIVATNKDGSIVAHFPVKWIHITRREGRELTEEERERSAEALRRYRESKRNA